jgi:hypothetical protein
MITLETVSIVSTLLMYGLFFYLKKGEGTMSMYKVNVDMILLVIGILSLALMYTIEWYWVMTVFSTMTIAGLLGTYVMVKRIQRSNKNKK